MLQDIDLSYDRTGALVTGKSLKVGGTLTVGGAPVGSPSTPQPADHGLIAWSADPNYAAGTSALASGTLYLAAVFIRAAATVSKVWWVHTAGGSGATAGQNFAGLYNSSGTLLSSVGIDSNITTNGPQSPSLAVAQPVTAGRYWVALLVNATSPPTLARTLGASATANNLNLSGATLRYCTNGTGLTALPSSITPASNSTTGALALPVAVS